MDKVYKRQYREQTPETKQKISAALKNKPKNDSHKKAISQGLKDYWAKIPSEKNEDGKSPIERGDVV